MIENVVRETGLSININSTTGGAHAPGSRHPGGMAVDINRINGCPVSQNNNNVQRLQDAFNQQSNILENYGPALNTRTEQGGTREDRPGQAAGHQTHIHVSGQR
jgi:hypothetical protein